MLTHPQLSIVILKNKVAVLAVGVMRVEIYDADGFAIVKPDQKILTYFLII